MSTMLDIKEENILQSIPKGDLHVHLNGAIPTDLVKNILETLETMDVEPVGVLTILYKSFKNIIDIQMSSNPTPESLNMSQKQFNAIKYNLGKFTNAELVKIFETLTSIDKKLKSGNLPAENIIEYLLINVL